MDSHDRNATLRMLVVGAGATGGYFGARLAAAGRDVTFIVRPARARQLQSGGLHVRSPLGDLQLRPRVVTAAELDGTYDIVLLAVKAYGLESAIADFTPAVGASTRILPLLNGMRHIDLLSERFGESAVLGGVCVVNTTLDADGGIVHLSELQELVYGERDGTLSAEVCALDAFVANVGFNARLSSEIVYDMWEKWMTLATLGAASGLLRGNVGEIEAAPGGRDTAFALFAECAAVATAAGYPPRAPAVARVRAILSAHGSTQSTSMYRDLQAGQALEAEHILGDLLARARAFSVAAPLLTAAFANLSIYAAKRAVIKEISATDATLSAGAA